MRRSEETNHMFEELEKGYQGLENRFLESKIEAMEFKLGSIEDNQRGLKENQLEMNQKMDILLREFRGKTVDSPGDPNKLHNPPPMPASFNSHKSKAIVKAPVSEVNPFGAYNMVEVAVSSNNTRSSSRESGNLFLSVHVLEKATKSFANENLIGCGGFGYIYKGILDDGTNIAVQRMYSGVIDNKQVDKFQVELAVLSKIWHRHIISLLGCATDGNERLLVYEHLPRGALSNHLFYWKVHNLRPLSWKRRLNIALDVARGMEYFHSLAQESLILHNVNPSNIMLDNEFRAKISDVGLVKLAPDRERSVTTMLAGTFGYLDTEYVVTGKVTSKVDVFRYGVVLMELLTGVMAFNLDHSDERRYHVEWFLRVKSSRETLVASLDRALDIDEEVFNSIFVVAQLAAHCTARNPNHRPDMGHVVSVLTPLVTEWKPFNDDIPYYSGIDFNSSSTSLEYSSNGSVDSFKVFDGR